MFILQNKKNWHWKANEIFPKLINSETELKIINQQETDNKAKDKIEKLVEYDKSTPSKNFQRETKQMKRKDLQ